jgi:hypothetical protein
MNSVAEVKSPDRIKVFEALLSSPGMNEACKVVIKPSRKTILILSRLVEKYVASESSESSDEMLSFLPGDAFSELQAIV